MVSAKTVDFSNVKEGGGRFNRNRLPAGDYLAKVIKVEDAETKNDSEFMYLFSFQISSHPSRIFPYYCKLQENQLWKLRNLLVAAGMSVPKKKLKLDPSKIVGKLIGVTLEDTEYDGKEQSEIAGVFPAAELADGNLQTSDVEDDEDDIDGEAADEPLEDDLDEDEEEATQGDEYDDMDRTALKKALKARDAEFVAKKSQSDDDLRDLLREADANAKAAAQVDEDDEEEEEEEPPAKPAAKRPARKTKKAPAKVEDISDDELDELDIDDI